jgi:hypothetical protein
MTCVTVTTNNRSRLKLKLMKRPVDFRLCDFLKEIQSLKLGKAYGFDIIPNECLQHLPRRPLVHLTHLFTVSDFVTSQHLGRKQKSQLYQNPAKTQNFP